MRRVLLVLALVGFVSAWQNCDRSLIRTLTTNGAQYTRATGIDLKEKESTFIFSYKGCKNARLRFTETANSLSKGFNINIDVIIKGNRKTEVNFRHGRNNKWTNMFNLWVGRKVFCSQFRDFWVSWDYDTRKFAIGAGKNPNAEEWASEIVPQNQLADVKFVHISSGPSNKGNWKLYKQCPSIIPVTSCGAGDTACTECKGKLVKTFQNKQSPAYTPVFDVVDMLQKKPVLVVGVKSCKGVRMRFLETKNVEGEGYNVNIDIQNPEEGDTEDDFHTFLNYRTGSAEGAKFVRTKDLLHPPKLDCKAFKYFWVKWDYETGKLSVGQGRDPSQGEYLYSMMTDFRKLEIRYLAVFSQRKNIADWKIYQQCNREVKPPPCKTSADCEENFRCNAGTCEECPEGTKLDSNECKAVCLNDDECTSDAACDVGTNTCNKCPAGTAPRMGYCDEICSATDKCTDPTHACIDGYCDPCGDHEIVKGAACVSICELKKNEDCSSKSKRYFYKVGQQICVEFQGCVDNHSNSFATKADCIDICNPKKIPPECLLDSDAGTCEDFSRRYYYDKELMACKKFEYNGCDGNANNFQSKEACRLHCAKYD